MASIPDFAPWPHYSAVDIAAVTRVLASGKVNYWTGTECRDFETEFARWVGTRHAIALTNGTVALDLALEGLGIGPGDEVIVTPRTFLASVSSVVNAGATPVFADIDRDSGNITAETIAPMITPRTKAIVPVHLGGWPCDMDPIMALAEAHGLFVIEDCAQAHGARYRGRSVGSIGHVAAWSFCQDKIMTTGGEGGMVTTNDEALWRRMWSFKDHGKDWDAVYNRQHPPGFRWVHESFGTNWRMLEMQAVLGRIQLARMGDWTLRRNALARSLAEALAGAEQHSLIRMPQARFDTADGPEVHAQYRFYAYLDPTRLGPGWTRERIVSEISAAGVPCFSGSCSEVYREKAFDGTPWRPAAPLPNARELGETSLAFLLHPTLSEAAVRHAGAVAASVLERASEGARDR
ncbi:MAG: DegT/DnrJ/EryC1/StrS family aminotransferase [Devosia sp.]